MAILLEAATIVVENTKLAEKYVGGVYGFMQDWRNGSYCTDGVLSRISFFDEGDAFCALLSLNDRGLEVSAKHAADVAVFVDGGQAKVPCLWLNTDWTFDGLPYCWHVEAEAGRLAVPRYYREGPSLASYGCLERHEAGSRVALVGRHRYKGIYRDNVSNQLMAGPLPLCRH